MITDLLSTAQKENLIERSLKKGEILFHEDEICEYVGIIRKGNIHIISYLPDGKEIIYNTLKDNEIFGNNLIFSSDRRYKGNIVAKSDCEIVLIRKDDLLDIIETNRAFLLEYLNIQSDFSKKLNNTIKLLSISDAKERFLFYMYSHQNKVKYESVTELSKRLFLKRETLSRILSRLEKDGVIYRTSGIISMYNQK